MVIRTGVVSFFYGLRDEGYYDRFITPLRVSRKQWEQIRTLLERRLAVETNQEVQNLIKSELSFIGGNQTLSEMYIYHSNQEAILKKFKNNFLIRRVIATDELYWIADNEPVPSKGPSGLQIWIRGASVGAEIHYVLPGWQLIVDGTVLPRGFYGDTIHVGGRTVELHYRDYRFSCSFPASKDRPPTKIEDLRPGFLADEA